MIHGTLIPAKTQDPTMELLPVLLFLLISRKNGGHSKEGNDETRNVGNVMVFASNERLRERRK
jgi:hypothetical protein